MGDGMCCRSRLGKFSPPRSAAKRGRGVVGLNRIQRDGCEIGIGGGLSKEPCSSSPDERNRGSWRLRSLVCEQSVKSPLGLAAGSNHHLVRERFWIGHGKRCWGEISLAGDGNVSWVSLAVAGMNPYYTVSRVQTTTKSHPAESKDWGETLRI